MIDQQPTFKAFVTLGSFLRDFCNDPAETSEWKSRLQDGIRLARQQNKWFTEENVHFALQNWGDLLTETKLTAWLQAYDAKAPSLGTPKTVALIMAGNIPLVGLHDFLCILLTGNKALCKLSSNDSALITFIADYLIHVEPSLESKIEFKEGTINGFEAVIATGSNNTARYFEHYFGKVPHIIRKNRNSVAVLSGKESTSQLKGLGQDVFRYFGLGCRSVSKLFVPKSYDFDLFFKAIYAFHPIVNELKYGNNYDYNKAVYLMSEYLLKDNGFLLLKEDTGYASPIACLFYEYYENTADLETRLSQDREQLQCIVSDGFPMESVGFGETQKPSLDDYADGVDTVDFLLKI